MMRSTMAAILMLAVLPAAAAERDYSPYLGIQGQEFTWEQGGLDDFRVDADSVAVVAGVEFADLFGAEARYAASVEGEDFGDVEVELDRLYGVYGRVTVPTQTFFDPYGLVGYSNARLEADGEPGDSEDGFSYGLGATFSLDGPLSLEAEWLQYLNRDELDVDSVNLGLTYRF